jgi:nitroimidazol reductase NimA-like FMN-containing flavoprotein (pyridoxamine 5'-phosphate oxidase superfamily)
MTEPVTSVDERFSERNAKPTAWKDTRAVIEAAELFWVTTVRSDGRPHVTPLVAVWSDGALYFSAGADEQKTLNLSHNTHVILTTGCNDWDKGLDVVVEGVASRVLEHEVLVQVAEVWTHKWDGRWNYAIGAEGFHHQDGETVMEENIYVYKVTPMKVLAFCKSPFSHTRHKF